MKHRLSRITTRTGDDGHTGLANGQRLPKHHPRLHAIGEVDELNTVLGLLLLHPLPEPLHAALLRCQHDLFDLGGELALPERPALSADHIERLEALQHQLNADLPPLTEFILPGGSPAAAHAHLLRTVCRRAERALSALAAAEPCAPWPLIYLNRLGDLAFVLARVLNRAASVPDVCWQNPRREATPPTTPDSP